MNLPTTMRPVKLMTLLLSATLLFSCKKDKDNNDTPSSFPKEVNIEYKVTATAGNLTKADVTYTNETGGISSVDNSALPFSKKLKKTVNKYEVLAISTTSSLPGGLKAEILIDNKVVKTETYTGNTIVHGIFTYQF
ncbi:MAG: hypothetical protein J7621_03285 [Niastella sp.]|nr:hypothetical protein [Niastella sp.]